MPRYKTVCDARCEHGHINLCDDRVIADSAAAARNTSMANVVKHKCAFCDSMSPLSIVQVLGTEEISLHVEYTMYGYTCHCGEKVEVERVEKDRAFTPPASKTVSCSRGHSRTVLNQEFPFLQIWQEKTN